MDDPGTAFTEGPGIWPFSLRCRSPITCIFLLRFETTTVRVTVHSLLGSAFFLGKVIVVRSGAFPGWALPVAGALLFAIFFGLWATSSLYLFSRNSLTL